MARTRAVQVMLERVLGMASQLSQGYSSVKVRRRALTIALRGV
jgi:hypothetical protein